MRTIAEVARKCSMLADADGSKHWIWHGALSGKATGNLPRIYAPDYTVDARGKTMKTQVGPRAAYHIKTRKPVPDGHRVFRTCTHRLCVNPDCVEARTCGDHGEIVAKRGDRKGNIRHVIANRKTNQSRTAVTLEKLQIIRSSPRQGLELQASLGVNRTTISRYRTGKPSCFDPVASAFNFMGLQAGAPDKPGRTRGDSNG